MRERVLAFVRAIVKSTHLNMNKSCAVGSLVRLPVHPYVRSSVCPFVRLSVRRGCDGGGGGGDSHIRTLVRHGGVFYTYAFMDCLMATAYKLDER